VIRCTMKAMKHNKVRRLRGETVLANREGTVILEPNREWPDGYVESFAGVPRDFERPPQGVIRKRRVRNKPG
jgi:hypothetical protein